MMSDLSDRQSDHNKPNRIYPEIQTSCMEIITHAIKSITKKPYDQKQHILLKLRRRNQIKIGKERPTP